MIKKIVSVVISAAAAMLLLSSCTAPQLAESFKREDVQAAAENAVTVFTSGDYEAFVTNLVKEEYQSELNADILREAKDKVMPKAGAFVEFGAENFVGKKDEKGDDYAAVVIIAKYEKQNVAFTVNLDKDLKIIGFFLR